MLNLAEIRDKRRLNARYVYENLKSPAFELLFDELPDGSTLFCIPALVERDRREHILDQLMTRGTLLGTLLDRWNFIPAGQETWFKNEVDFMARNVLIPINEFLDEQAMERLVCELNRI
ncbi:MAG: hypothetical protein JWM41_3915 [Gemmatimonadetes bacterium]|nr:hypothetical protein [Gemmatimonadota bacterium]